MKAVSILLSMKADVQWFDLNDNYEAVMGASCFPHASLSSANSVGLIGID
jgi:hypothetical protein